MGDRLDQKRRDVISQLRSARAAAAAAVDTQCLHLLEINNEKEILVLFFMGLFLELFDSPGARPLLFLPRGDGFGNSRFKTTNCPPPSKQLGGSRPETFSTTLTAVVR